MHYPLRELLQNDFNKLAFILTPHVASEEAIKYLIHLYRNQLINPLFVKHDNLKIVLEPILKSYKAEQGTKRYQLFIEFGQRSKKTAYDPGTIHYTAAEIVLQPDGNHFSFVVDHLKGHALEVKPLKELEQSYGISRAQAGGAVYQADSYHCPIFVLEHLLMTATIPNLQAAVPAQPLVQWTELPPDLAVNSQSVSLVLRCLEAVNTRETSGNKPMRTSDQHSPTLTRFAPKLHASLYPEKKEDNKLKNKGIEYAAAKHAGAAVLQLDKEAEDDERLIDICYEQHHLISVVLKKALKTQDPKNGPHPLFKIIFYNIEPFTICLSDPKFQAIFNNADVLELMECKFINAVKLYESLTIQQEQISLNNQAVNIVFENLLAIKTINECHKAGISLLINGNDLLLNPKIKACLADHRVKKLLLNGHLTLDEALQVIPFKIKEKEFNKLNTDSSQAKYLKDFCTAKKLPESSDLFEIPDSDGKYAEGKAAVNIRFLANSVRGAIAAQEPGPKPVVSTETENSMLEGLGFGN